MNGEGQITFQIDGQQTTTAGGSAFAAGGTAHTFQNFGPAPARMLVMLAPVHFQHFLQELSSLNQGLSTPDLVRTEQLTNEYGVELLGRRCCCEGFKQEESV